MLKYIYAAIVAGIVVTLNILWGSAISWFLSLTILAVITYFILQLQLEDVVNHTFQTKKKDIAGDPAIGHKLFLFEQKWAALLKFSALAVVFAAGVYCIKTTTDPVGKKPWFLNNDYHGLSNAGIAFDDVLPLISTSTDSNTRGGSLSVKSEGNKASLQFNNYFVPVFKPLGEGKNELLNNVFPQPIRQSLKLTNGNFEISISVKPYEPGLFKKLFSDEQDGLAFDIQLVANNKELLEQWNLAAPFQDHIHVVTGPLETGRQLFELLLNGRTFESGKPETYQVLETALQELGESYFLVHYQGDEKQYRLFPSKGLFDNGYAVNIDGQAAAPQKTNATGIGNNEHFFIGFGNQRKQLYVAAFDASGYSLAKPFPHALYFDYPNTYMLSSPGKQEAGNKNTRFITNDLDRIIDNDWKEGFLFSTYQLTTPTSVNGNLDYFSGQPNTALELSVADFNASAAAMQVSHQKFSLLTADKNCQYLFQVRDFSDNGFSTEKSVLYLGIIFLAFMVLLVFFPGENLARIEPIILMVIMALAVLRFILYWRVATFPPLENISKHELENTLLNFDFNIGVHSPLPLTVVWIVLLVLLLIGYRAKLLNRWIPDFDHFFAKINTRLRNINLQYIAFAGICLVLFVVNKKVLHIEVLTRIVSILIPLLGYVYYSGKANKVYQYKPKPILYGGRKNWLEHLHAIPYYFFHNPTTFITLTTLIFFALTDRGFAILFFLFLLLKNILVNFLKKPLANTSVSIPNRLFSPKNFWIYGFIALALYLVMLSVKSLFYYLLIYKVCVLFWVLALVALVIYALQGSKKLKQISIGLALFTGILAAIPATNRWMDTQMGDVVKHVQYRASIIYQPIQQLLQDNEYTSFKTQKIIETAENQWFINSYISKPYDNSETINLRAHSKIGVDYSTQTRDVVLARYVISEWGNFTMSLILLLLVLPMVFYLIAYRFTLVTSEARDVESYTGLIPLLMLFTIALFVWLTATNRFVFFGQDFPFLSLTSKLSVLLPLLLWALTLTRKPTYKHSFRVNVKEDIVKYILFIALIAVFALTTIRKNELNNDNFSIVMETTKGYIENNLNGILANIQDGMESRNEKVSYNKIINELATDTNFNELRRDVVKDNYTRSILNNLVRKPATAFRLDNPLFMIYDNGRYNAVYNKNLYLELPPVESRKVWQGNILEYAQNANQASVLLSIDKEKTQVNLPFFTHNPVENYQLAILPKRWVKDARDNVGILNIINTKNSGTSVYIYKNAQKNTIQNATSFAGTLQYDDVATLYQNSEVHQIGFQSAGNKYATNKWINGNYRILYPLRQQNFWIYSYANAIRAAYSNDSMLLANSYITLDYALSSGVQNAVQQSAAQNSTKPANANFSVMCADGDGNIRFMNDYVSRRQMIDPNDQNTILALQRKQFFYSNARNERDQWGNRNLLNLYLGPGSSIKPLTVAAVASQVNAGWEQLYFTPPGGDRESYAGFRLIRPWKNDEHYYGNMGIPGFIAHSSNFYHSLYLFLGSYTKEDFHRGDHYSLANAMTQQPGASNDFPVVNYGGQAYHFKNYSSKEWPHTDKSARHKSYYGNENSLLANGFETNLTLRTKDKDKLDRKPTTDDRVYFVDSTLANALSHNRNTGYLWSFPEESYFLQSDRANAERNQNFNLGVMTASLGGYPFRITPYKMTEMYLAMFTQNNNLRLSIVPQKLPASPWKIDASWNNGFNTFLAANVFEGMKQVITGGTGTRLQPLASANSPYFFYAKTGTINEQQSGRKSSRRLMLTITDKDMTLAENAGKAKVYALYFVTDNTQDFDWNLIYEITNRTIQSSTFKQYFNH